jgi:hypothetical protein
MKAARRAARYQTLKELMLRPGYSTYYLAVWDWIAGKSPCPPVPPQCSQIGAAAIRQYLSGECHE